MCIRDRCRDSGIKFELASSYNPQSNGSTECSVKCTKHTILKAMDKGEDVDVAIMEYRNSTMKDGPMPSTMFYRRFLRSPHLPALPRNYTDGQIASDESRRSHYNRHDTNKNKPASYHWSPKNFKIGDRVLMQDCVPTGTNLWDKKAVVVQTRMSGRR